MNKKITTKRKRKYLNHQEQKQYNQTKREKIVNIRNLISKKKFDLALISIENYINSYSLDCYVIHEYGKYFLKQLEFDKAKYYFLTNIRNDSENKYYSMYELGQIAKFEYDYDLANYYFNEILNSNHNEKCYSLLEIAKINILKEKYFEGEEILLKIIDEQMPNYTYALEEMIELKITLNEIKEACYYLNILKEKNNSDKCKLLEAKIETKKGNLKKGRDLYKKIENNSKYTINAKIERAKIEYELYNYYDSLKLLETIKDMINYDSVDIVFLYINNYISLKDKDKALEKINQLMNYGKEYTSNTYYYLAKLEIMDKNYDKAIEYFDMITDEKIKTYKLAKLQKILIYIKQNNYLEAYNEFKIFTSIKLNSEFDKTEKILKVYFNKILNLNIHIKINSYLEKMIVNYDKEEVLKHISKHKEIDNEKKNHTLINKDIDIEKLYDFAYNNINDDNFFENKFTDSYILKYDNIGYSSEKKLNYIKVITLPNTKEIITIFPCDNNPIIKEEVKIKKISQIDKFNKKYSIRKH